MEPRTTRRFRQTASGARILVGVGDRVTPHTVIARIDTMPGRLARVRAAEGIGVGARDLPKYMVVGPGQSVKRGDPVATRVEFFHRRAAFSPVDGMVAAISKNLGCVYVRQLIEVGEAQGPVIFDIPKLLGIRLDEMRDHLAPGIIEGAVVAKGQVVGSVNRQKKGIPYMTGAAAQLGDDPNVIEGPHRTSILSPILGKIRGIRLDLGTVRIAPIYPAPETYAYLGGVVTDIVPEQGVEIQGDAVVLEGIWGMGKEALGTVCTMSGDILEPVPPLPGAILVVRGTATTGALWAASRAGAVGAILGYLPSEAVLEFVGPSGNLGITGEEDVPFPIIVMEGFDPRPMKKTDFDIYRRHEGESTSICGVTHIRAGVRRPEALLTGVTTERGDHLGL